MADKGMIDTFRNNGKKTPSPYPSPFKGEGKKM